jgi:hypothetical protein
MSDLNQKNPKPLLPVGTKIVFMMNNKTYIKKTNGNPFSLWKSPGGGTILIDDERVLKKDLYKILTENEVSPTGAGINSQTEGIPGDQ